MTSSLRDEAPTEKDKLDIEETELGPVFNPPLYKQRYLFAIQLLTSEHIKSVSICLFTVCLIDDNAC